MDIRNIRSEYGREELTEDGLPDDPFQLFEVWLNEAGEREHMEGIAFTLATVGTNGKPSARTVLLRGVEEGGFSFFTNYHSRKGKELEGNKSVVAHFFWPECQRQVRISGDIKKVSEANSDDYFASRPRESQIGAWASAQSETIPNREWLEQQVEKFSKQFKEQDVPRPEHWGGYVVVPESIEFWQGRLSRLHDRIIYEREGESWKTSRLSP